MNMTKQRIMGFTLVTISVFMLFFASTGKTPEDRDATAVLFTLPLGLYMMITKQYVLYDGEESAEAEEENEQPGSQLPGYIARKEFQNGTKKNCRGPRLQDVGRSGCHAPGNR